MLGAESYLAVLLVVLEGAEGGVGIPKLRKVLSDAEGILSVVAALEHEYLGVGAVDAHDVVVEGLGEGDGVGSAIQDYVIFAIPERLDGSELVGYVLELHICFLGAKLIV